MNLNQFLSIFYIYLYIYCPFDQRSRLRCAPNAVEHS